MCHVVGIAIMSNDLRPRFVYSVQRKEIVIEYQLKIHARIIRWQCAVLNNLVGHGFTGVCAIWRRKSKLPRRGVFKQDGDRGGEERKICINPRGVREIKIIVENGIQAQVMGIDEDAIRYTVEKKIGGSEAKEQ